MILFLAFRFREQTAGSTLLYARGSYRSYAKSRLQTISIPFILEQITGNIMSQKYQI